VADDVDVPACVKSDVRLRADREPLGH